MEQTYSDMGYRMSKGKEAEHTSYMISTWHQAPTSHLVMWLRSSPSSAPLKESISETSSQMALCSPLPVKLSHSGKTESLSAYAFTLH